MAEVPVRQLNQDAAGVLARVKRGEQIEVTERGVVIARLVPVPGHPLADLITAGTLHPARRRGPMPRPVGPGRPDVEAGEMLEQLRDDERY